MKKIIAIFLLLIMNAAQAQTLDEGNMEPESIKQDENKSVKSSEKLQNEKEEEQTGAAVSTEKFKYETCTGDEETRACKIEDLIKEDEKNDNSLP